MIFREKLVNASTGEVRQGNVLDSSLGEVEQIMIDSSLCSVMYYWVKTPDNTWRKTQYYELVENLYSIIYKVNDSIYQTYYLLEGDDVPVPDYTPGTGYTWSGWLNENIPAKMPASDIVVESYTEQTDYAIIYYIDGRVVYSETHHYNDSITAYVPETREHYVFSGWSGFPQSGLMPAENVTVTGTYEEDLSYVLSYYVDASVYTQQSYMSNDAVDAPDDPQVEEGYSWSGWIDLPSLMPAYDSSVHSVLTANQYILDYYVDSSLWNSLIYNYKQTIVPLTYTPAEGYLFSGWVNEPETMPAINHYRVDGMTQLIPVLYNVYWFIDSSLIQTAQYAPGSTVTSPLCQDPDYVYNWNGYDTFTMASADTSIYGEKNIITYTVSWYIDSSLIQTGEYAPGSTVTSPLCQDPDYVYDWNGYDTFTMASADTSIYGEKIAKSEPIDPSIYIDSSLFGISLEQYNESVTNPIVELGYFGTSYTNSSVNSGVPGFVYVVKPESNVGYMIPVENVDSSIPAVFKYQTSQDGVNWADVDYIEFNTDVENKTVDNNIVHLPELSSYAYLRLTLKSIDSNTLTLNQIQNGSHYAIILSKYPNSGPVYGSRSVFILDNTLNDSEYQIFGNFDSFYSHIKDLLNNTFNANLGMHGIVLSISNNVCHAHNAYEHTAHNYISSGIRYWDGDEYNISFPATCGIKTAPVILATDVFADCYACRWYDCRLLTTAPELPATTVAERCYYEMFAGCTALTEAPELPATTLAYECYMEMFTGCTALTEAPELPATALNYGCYASMFEGCTALTEAPELPATTVVYMCYMEMFAGCTALTEAPELPATTLAQRCYCGMFAGCTSLATGPTVLPATIVLPFAYWRMFKDCYVLTSPPRIDGTSYGLYACQLMFENCKILSHKAVMPANYDASTNAFDNMYWGCNYIND